jgi:hypothetical protein
LVGNAAVAAGAPPTLENTLSAGAGASLIGKSCRSRSSTASRRKCDCSDNTPAALAWIEALLRLAKAARASVVEAPTTCCQARLEVAVSSALATAASFGVEARSAKRSALREVVR